MQYSSSLYRTEVHFAVKYTEWYSSTLYSRAGHGACAWYKVAVSSSAPPVSRNPPPPQPDIRMLWIVIASGLLAVTARPDGPGGHHHGAHHGDHGAHHGAHHGANGAHHGDHGAQGAHHGDHGVHNAQHGVVVQSAPVQHQVVHRSAGEYS